MNKPNPLKPGAKAPKFSAFDQDGIEYHKESLLGTRYLIYFYPRDLTPGCTTEACNMRDVYEDIRELGVLILGISPDHAKSHRKFIDKYKLPFPLLVDEDHSIAEAFGVWGEKKFMGRTFDGVHRMSFLVGQDWKIEKTYEKVKPAEHAQQVLNDLQI